MDGTAPTPTGEGGAIRTENDARDIAAMFGEDGECFTGVCIPQADGTVRTPTSEGFSIRTENDAVDTGRMSGEGG